MMKSLLFSMLLILFSFPAAAQSVDLGKVVTESHPGIVLHYPERFNPVIPKFVETATSSATRLQSELGIEDWKPVDVWLLPKVEDYFHYNNLPVISPKWAAGLSLSNRGVIIIAHGSANGTVHEIYKTLKHEMAHVGIDRAKQGAAVPRWLHEGYAVWFADEWTHERSDRLTQAAGFGRVKFFNVIERTFPSHQLSASLAYDQSFHFVRWLGQRYGADVYKKIFAEVRSQEFEAAFETAAGEKLGVAETAWRAELDEGTSVWGFLRDSGMLFFFAGVLFFFAFIVRRRKNKQRIASMPDEPGPWDYDPSKYPLPGQG